MKQNGRHVTTLRIPDETYAQLEKISDAELRSINMTILLAVRDFLTIRAPERNGKLEDTEVQK